jgi:F0F1-type ATP synthase delta subunit
MDKAELFIAGPWSEAQLAALRDQLTERYQPSTAFITRRDDSLIGGFVAKVDGKVLDASIAGKLSRLMDSLKANLPS